MSTEKIKTRLGWRFRFRVLYRGVKFCSPSIYTTKKEAELAERAKVLEIEEDIKNPKKDMRLMELMNDRLDHLKLKRSEKYYKENKRFFKMFLEAMGDVMVSTITKKQVNSFLNKWAEDLQERKKTNYKANACLRVLKSLFFYGQRIHELKNNPFVGIELFSVDKKLKYIPSDTEIEAILALCDEGEALLINFVMETGARINEALALRPEDIQEGYVILYTRKSKNSNRVPRKVPCTLDLKGYKGFGIRWKKHPRFLEKKITKLKQKSWNWHNLRHRRASLWSKQGLPIFTISYYLGHTSIETTQIYLQMLP